ncbi:MAG: hypothetical protein KIG68_00365 [Oxalobacter sp.]|nr:hypothetical protein [Oxalobacter sp.]
MTDFFRKKTLWTGMLAIICLLFLQSLIPLVESTHHHCDDGHCVVCTCLAEAGHTLEKTGTVPPSSQALQPSPILPLFAGMVLLCLTIVQTRTPITDWNRMNN